MTQEQDVETEMTLKEFLAIVLIANLILCILILMDVYL